MSSSFTPSNVVDMSKERDWASSLGMMDWDSTRIVFTKRTLIEFLRYTGVTIDTNFTNISRLPKYATFGKIVDSAATASAEASKGAAAEATSQENENESDPQPLDTINGFKPTRRVRTAPGGETHDIFGHYADDDGVAIPPSQSGLFKGTDKNKMSTQSPWYDEDEEEAEAKPEPKAKAKKAEAEAEAEVEVEVQSGGGHSRKTSMWDDVDSPSGEFKPTRRVRERPGGRDHIGDLLSRDF